MSTPSVTILHTFMLSAICGTSLALIACGSKKSTVVDPPITGPSPSVTGVTVAGNNTVTVGGTVQFTATASLSNSSTQNVSGTATWTSSNTNVATVSSAGLATAASAGTTEIRAAQSGFTGTAPLQVNAAPAVLPVARFTVSGPRGTNACTIINNGNALDCTFDGSTSTGGSGGAVTEWTWRWDVGQNSSNPFRRNTPLFTPEPGCGFFNDTPDPNSSGFVNMIVKLVVRNAAGTESAETRNNDVRLFPQGACGF